jgi:hypothetical protein
MWRDMEIPMLKIDLPEIQHPWNTTMLLGFGQIRDRFPRFA